MNSVLVYKQLNLGEGLADLFASEIKNLELFKKSLSLAHGIRNKLSFGYDECYDKTHDRTFERHDNGHNDTCNK